MAAIPGAGAPPGDPPLAGGPYPSPPPRPGVTEPYAGAPPHPELPAPSLTQIVGQLFDDLRSALQARAHLLALEAQRAGLALTLMAAYAVLAALLLLTAWLALWGVLLWFVTALGAPLGLVLVVALLLSTGAAWLLLRMARAEARHLLFPASVRQLAGAAPPADAAAPAARQETPHA